MQSDPTSAIMMELRFLPLEGDVYAVNASARLPQSAGMIDLISGRAASVRFDPEVLMALHHDPECYGNSLSEMLFAQPLVREALLKVRSQADALGLQLRLVLRLDPTDPILHALAWETLSDPGGGGPLFVGERIVLSRYLDSTDMAPLKPRPKSALSAVIAVASPNDLDRYGLAAIDQEGEVARASEALGSIPTRVLSRKSGTTATLNQVAAALRDGPDILYLVCHGTSRAGQPLIWLEDAAGASDRVSGEAFVRMVAGLERRPLLIVLASCQSAGEGADILAALGPRLVSAGVAAVLAMQGQISVESVALMMPTFFRELSRDGQIDRAVAVARTTLLHRTDWWLPVLFLRLYDGRIWADLRQPDANTLDALAMRNRTRMLDKVRDFWVRGVLEFAVGHTAIADLSLILRYDALANPWTGIVQRYANEHAQQRISGRRIVSIFDDARGELLILGRPGSGKTTLMLTLARSLIERAERDPALPIPVVFNLASWGARHTTLDDWLIEELYERYDVPREMAQGWIHQRQVLPLLDGLDEVRVEQRANCLAAINTFDRSESMGNMIVCSRIDEYEQAGVLLRLEAAVEVLPLSEREVLDYLDRGGEAMAHVRALFGRDPAFSALLETPLMLSVVSAAYRGDVNIPISISASIWRRYIFSAYVRRMLDQREGLRYTQEKILHWLSILARTLQFQSQSTFLIERIQPHWLQNPNDLGGYRLLIRLLSGLCLGLSSTAVITPVGGWRMGLASGIAGLLVWAFSWGRLRPWAIAICYGLAVAGALIFAGQEIAMNYLLSYAALAGVITGTGAFLVAQQTSFTQIACVPSLRWSWGRGLRVGLLALLIGGMPTTLLLLLLTRDWSIILVAGTAVGMCTGTLAGLAVGMNVRELEASARPNDGIRRTLRTSARVAMIAGPIFGLVGVLLGVALGNTAENLQLDLMPGLAKPWLTGLSGMLAGLLVSFFSFGGMAALQHYLLRLMILRVGSAPWKMADFLDECAKRALLRKVGGGYIFIHRTLLEYFADGPEC